MFRINNNISSLVAQRHLNVTSKNTQTAIERLSSGLRINRAADDAAAMFISEQMRSQIAALKQANRNTAQATTLLQVMEGGLDQLTGMMTRLKELAIQAADGSYSDSQRQKGIQVEADQLLQELERVMKGITFNGITLFPNTAGYVTFQVGEYTFDKIVLPLTQLTTYSLLGSFAVLFNNSAASQAFVAMNPAQSAVITFFADAASGQIALGAPFVDAFLSQIASGIDAVISQRARLGAIQNRLERTATSIAINIENTTNAESVIRDADMASETSALVRAQILAQAGTAVLNQANLLSQNALNLLSSLG
jgi:flagellin